MISSILDLKKKKEKEKSKSLPPQKPGHTCVTRLTKARGLALAFMAIAA